MSRYHINFKLANLNGRFDELARETALPLGRARILYELGILRKYGHPLLNNSDAAYLGVKLHDFVHANEGFGTVMATGIDQQAQGGSYPARVVDFPNFQKDPETGVYRMEHTANSRKGETTIVPSGFVLFVPGEKRLYDGFGFAHQTTTDKGEAIASQTAYFKLLGLDEQIAADVARAEMSYSWRRDGVDGVFAVLRDFLNERVGPWDVSTYSRPLDRDDDVGAVLSKEAASGASAEATDELKELLRAGNEAYAMFERADIQKE